MVKLKISSPLWNRAEKAAQLIGYSSTEEFIVHVLEKELERIESVDGDQKIEDRLRGLGYI